MESSRTIPISPSCLAVNWCWQRRWIQLDNSSLLCPKYYSRIELASQIQVLKWKSTQQILYVWHPSLSHFEIDRSQLHRLIQLRARAFSPQSVANKLNLAVEVLPELSILAGNDFTRSFIEVCCSSSLMLLSLLPEISFVQFSTTSYCWHRECKLVTDGNVLYNRVCALNK